MMAGIQYVIERVRWRLKADFDIDQVSLGRIVALAGFDDGSVSCDEGGFGERRCASGLEADLGD